MKNSIFNLMVSEFKIFVWHSPTGGWGCYNMVSELQFSTLSLDGPSKMNVEDKFHRELISEVAKFQVTVRPW
jgi:hypothetical protein